MLHHPYSPWWASAITVMKVINKGVGFNLNDAYISRDSLMLQQVKVREVTYRGVNGNFKNNNEFGL
jgi:hypothetical protein